MEKFVFFGKLLNGGDKIERIKFKLLVGCGYFLKLRNEHKIKRKYSVKN